MPRFDYSKHDSSNLGGYAVVTPGRYLCRVKDIKVDSTSKGDVMWKLEFVIEEDGSEFYGSRLFDNLIFSDKAAARAKLIFESFGVDVSLEREYLPSDLQDQYALVTVDRIEEYTIQSGEHAGQKRKKSVIAYAGYSNPNLSISSETNKEEITF